MSPTDFRTAILTIKSQSEIILEKTLADATIGEDSLSWTLTQQETLHIGTRSGKMIGSFQSCKRGDLIAQDEVILDGDLSLDIPD